MSAREHLARLGCWGGNSVGQIESLAGIDPQSHKERRDLWRRFEHLFCGPGQVVIDAVMEHCAAIALQRIERGELCLLTGNR